MKISYCYLRYLKVACLIVPGILLFSCFPACKQHSSVSDAYYDSLFEKLKREYVLSHYSHRYVAQFDSIYRNTSRPSAYFTYKRYMFSAIYYYDAGSLDTARIYSDSCVYALEHGDLTEKYKLQYAAALDGKADYAFNNGDLDKAFECYNKSRNVRLRVKDDTCALSNTSYRLGMVAYKQEKYQEAINAFKESLGEIGYCDDAFGKYNRTQEEYNNIALAYTRLSNNDSALLYYDKALNYIISNEKTFVSSPREARFMENARGVVYGNLAKVYTAIGKYDTAEQLLKNAIAINSNPGGDLRDAMFCNMQLAELYYKTDRADRLQEVMAGLRQALDTMSNPPVNIRWHHLAYLYDNKTGKTAGALHHLIAYDELRDSVAKAMEQLKKTDYRQIIKDQETQYQIRLLKKDNQLSKLYLWSTFGVVAVAIIIIALVYYNYRRGRRNIQVLTALNVQVNEQKQQLEDAMVQLKENNDDKDRILRIVAHDLRTPINGIMMVSDFALLEEDDPSKKESLNMIISASKNLLHLTNELLEYSGNDKLLQRGTRENTNINELVRQSVGLLMFKAQEKKQIITFATAPFPVTIDVQREKISRVISNLISNALKFSKDGAVVKVTLSADDKKATIRVEDFGIGIPEKMLPHIFEPFTSAKRHGTHGERSYGLGLSICKQIVDAHNGRIWAESKEGQGSVFYVELPRNLVNDKNGEV